MMRLTASGAAQHVDAGDARRARGGGQEGGEDFDGRGLARAVGAEQAFDGAFVDAEVEAGQSMDDAIARLIGFVQIYCFDERQVGLPLQYRPRTGSS